MKKLIYLILLVTAFNRLSAQQLPYSQRMAQTAMHIWSDTSSKAHWTYETGVIMKGVERVWEQTADRSYFKYVQNYVDLLIDNNGTIKGYKKDDYNIDNVLTGRSVLMLYQVLGAEKYYKAVTTLRDQLKSQPRTVQGGFWHKKRYPNQMWLDGLYMGEPFYAEYADAFGETADFDDIANQFILIEQHARDPKTGLLYHAWDESRKEKWADPKTGLSKNFWGRADGWYAMALVDVLDKFQVNHPKRAELLAILNSLAVAIKKYQDPKSGVWYQILDKGGKPGNYLEASASCMFVYALAKGVRQGYLPNRYLSAAKKGFNGIIKKFITVDAQGQTNLNGTVSVAGLGGNPYRDGTYEYYLSEKVVTNDPKGVGAFIQAAVEVERLGHLAAGKGKTVLLDSYFNNEHRTDKYTGKTISYHYKWDEMDNNGSSFLAHLIHNYGLKTATLQQAPTAANLKNAAVYTIIDPDIPKENPEAKYIEAPHIKAIADWVKAGGVLMVFNNDTGNAEFKHLNVLMAKFGIAFNQDSKNRVTGTQFDMGAIEIPAGNAIFKTARKVYIKELSSIKTISPAVPVLSHKGDVVVATAKYGKGIVFAVGDPWFYNEYTDGRKLPASFENYRAANDVIAWVVKQLPVAKK